jgi:polysaccharide biosynthesis transport protein
VNERVHMSEVGWAFRRLWWIVVLLSALGAAAGLTAAQNVPPVYRSQATLLVGPTDGAITHTSTIRTSEDLAKFYADMARREIVLGPVNRKLGLDGTWVTLRNRVSSEVPDENLRLVTVTVMGPRQAETRGIADAIVSEVVALSPAVDAADDQAFVNQQAARLKSRIRSTQQSLDELRRELANADSTDAQNQISNNIAREADLLDSWQRAYVEYIAAEPTSGAGGLQVLDPAAPAPDQGRSSEIRLALVGSAGGATLGLLVAWLWHRRSSRRREAGPPSYPPTVRKVPARASNGRSTGRGRPLRHPDRGAGAPKGPSGKRQPVSSGSGHLS